jgi:hypothetical protein
MIFYTHTQFMGIILNCVHNLKFHLSTEGLASIYIACGYIMRVCVRKGYTHARDYLACVGVKNQPKRTQCQKQIRQKL